MNLKLFQNTTDFWVPTFLLNSDLSWTHLPLFILQFFLILITSWLIIFSIILMRNHQKLHPNATWILIITCAAWFECAIGMMLILPYKYGVISLEEPSKVYYGFESDEFLSLEISWKSGPLILGSVLVWHYLGLLNGGIAIFVVERSIATLLLSNYELKPRRWIFWFLMTAHQLSATNLCLICTFHMLPLNILLGFNVLGMLFFVPHIYFLRYYNKTARNRLRLAENITKHSLTAKFQTEENVRSMNIATSLASVAGVFNIFYLIIIFLATQRAPGAEIFFQATEIVLFFNPIFTIPGVIWGVPDWKRRFLGYLGMGRLRVDPRHNQYMVPDSNLSRVHFSQLDTLWI